MSEEMKKCPFCGEEIKETAKKCRYCGEWLNKQTPKKVEQGRRCPYCGEEINDNAKKCKHCGEWLIKSEVKNHSEIQDSKRCEFCSSIIPIRAERCPKCGEWLVDERYELSYGYWTDNPVVKFLLWFNFLIATFIFVLGTIFAFIALFEEDPAAVIGGYIIFLIILIIGAILFFISGYIYFLPSIIASSKRHPQFVPILLINLFFGETVIGWVGTMVWAATHRMGRHTHW